MEVSRGGDVHDVELLRDQTFVPDVEQASLPALRVSERAAVAAIQDQQHFPRAVAFVREVASRTEVYWCPIKHARRVLGPHPHYQGFADFGDAEGFRERLAQMKDGVKIEGPS